MPAPKRKTPARRKRTSDPNLEPGLAAATRRSQAPKKKASPQGGAAGITRGRALGAKSAPPRAELKSLQKQMIEKMMEAMRPFKSPGRATPKKKAPAELQGGAAGIKRGRALGAKSAPPRGKRKPAPVSPRQLLPTPPRRKGDPAPTRRRVNPRTMELMPPTPRRKPATPKKRAPARPRAAAPRKRLK